LPQVNERCNRATQAAAILPGKCFVSKSSGIRICAYHASYATTLEPQRKGRKRKSAPVHIMGKHMRSTGWSKVSVHLTMI
jgi:hypothetical protein